MTDTRVTCLEGVSDQPNRFVRTWLIRAPWAHMAWQEYALLLYDIRRTAEMPDMVHHRDGVTHEFLLHALSPEHAIDFEHPSLDGIVLLNPANMGYQFTALSDEIAHQRVQICVDAISKGTLSPDTDFRTMWDNLFSDGIPLVVNVFGVMAEAEKATKQ